MVNKKCVYIFRFKVVEDGHCQTRFMSTADMDSELLWYFYYCLNALKAVRPKPDLSRRSYVLRVFIISNSYQKTAQVLHMKLMQSKYLLLLAFKLKCVSKMYIFFFKC